MWHWLTGIPGPFPVVYRGMPASGSKTSSGAVCARQRVTGGAPRRVTSRRCYSAVLLPATLRDDRPRCRLAERGFVGPETTSTLRIDQRLSNQAPTGRARSGPVPKQLAPAFSPVRRPIARQEILAGAVSCDCKRGASYDTAPPVYDRDSQSASVRQPRCIWDLRRVG